MVSVIVGGQFGDEGKGKIISYMCSKDNYDFVARGGVGPNAGHTVVYKNEKYKVRQIPSGFIDKKSRILIGPGVLINPDVLMNELIKFRDFNVDKRLGVDKKCGIIEREHIQRDAQNSLLSDIIQTTKTGCGPANEDRVKRIGKIAEEIECLKKYITDVSEELNNAIDEKKKILVEGTQGFGLSLYHGTYPYVTTKDTTASTILADVGLGPRTATEVVVVLKAYVSRVGGGELKTEISEKEAEKKGIIEYGSVTGRRRRIGDFDFELAKRSVRINSASFIALTCIDRLFDCAGVKEYNTLPDDAKKFVKKIEDYVGVKVKLISTGEKIEDTIDLRD